MISDFCGIIHKCSYTCLQITVSPNVNMLQPVLELHEGTKEQEATDKEQCAMCYL